MTNFERIKNMSVEELAKGLDRLSIDCKECPICEFCDNIRSEVRRVPFCKTVWKQWLKSEVEE